MERNISTIQGVEILVVAQPRVIESRLLHVRLSIEQIIQSIWRVEEYDVGRRSELTTCLLSVAAQLDNLLLLTMDLKLLP